MLYTTKEEFKIGDIVYIKKSLCKIDWKLRKHLMSPLVVINTPILNGNKMYGVSLLNDQSMTAINVLEIFISLTPDKD